MPPFLQYALRILIYPLSYIPFTVMFWFSNFLGFLLHKILRYRVKVVKENLHRVFPEKQPAEIEKITRKYYRYVADMMIEGIKSFSISEAEAVRRCRAINPELTNEYYDKNQSNFLLL